MGSYQTVQCGAASLQEQSAWYALHIRAKHEKRVAAELVRRGVNVFLPLVTEVHKWSDRNMKVEIPLFSCYAFVNLDSSPEARVSVLRAPGVLALVGGNSEGAVIPDHEIESIRALLTKKLPFAAHSFLNVGQRVRIRGGALDGIEGILTRCASGSRLVLSVQTIQRSLSISVEGYQVEVVGQQAKVC
jgi:transcription antitermination factor NusG